MLKYLNYDTKILVDVVISVSQSPFSRLTVMVEKWRANEGKATLLYKTN